MINEKCVIVAKREKTGYNMNTENGGINVRTIGERIRRLRESKGLSSKDLSNSLDINISTYSKLENDKKSIGVSELKKITEYFSVSADHILGIDKQENDMVVYMRKEKNMSKDDIEEVKMILSMMDEAVSILEMKKRIQ